MKFLRYAVPAVALLALGAGKAHAQQEVTLAVNPINEIDFAGSATLTISSATAGSAPTVASDNSLTYAITTNQTGGRITAQMSGPALTSGLVLTADLAAPTGATHVSAVDLSDALVHDVVSDLHPVNASGLGITYSLSATAAAGTLDPTTRTITYTIIAGI